MISRMVDVVMIRTFEQTKIERFAAYSRVPVINGLTNEFHPCQVLADLYTYIELRGPIQGRTVAWIGDSNNMCYTWLQAAQFAGFKVMSRSAATTARPARAGDAAAACTTWNSPPDGGRALAPMSLPRRWPAWFEAENEERAPVRRCACRGHEEVAQRTLFITAASHAARSDRGRMEGPHSVVWEEAENRYTPEACWSMVIGVQRNEPRRRSPAVARAWSENNGFLRDTAAVSFCG